jgi:hypothetical protein
MPVARQKWPYQQVADGIAAQIASGEYAQGDQLPSLEEIAGTWQVSHETAHRAVALLRSRRLVTTTPRVGSFVGAPREIPGPQQLLAGVRFPAADAIEVTAAGLAAAPGYIAPILGLTEAKPGFWPVGRREQVLYERDGLPLMLMVQWFPPELVNQVPALAGPDPLAPGDELPLLARAGRPVTRWTHSREARKILDDGREGPLLRLPQHSYVLAETYIWGDAAGAAEYGEYALIPNRVTVNEGTIESPDTAPG